VTLTKDYTKWNFDTLQDLIEGAFLNPKRLEEAIRVSKYMRRLMSFFHPFSRRFSDIDRRVCPEFFSSLTKGYCSNTGMQGNQRWVKLGCSLLTTLMASPDGQRFLSTEDPFLRDIVKAFAQLDPVRMLPSHRFSFIQHTLLLVQRDTRFRSYLFEKSSPGYSDIRLF
jgi:rapamycin-insensitive companion of mTOR